MNPEDQTHCSSLFIPFCRSRTKRVHQPQMTSTKTRAIRERWLQKAPARRRRLLAPHLPCSPPLRYIVDEDIPPRSPPPVFASISAVLTSANSRRVAMPMERKEDESCMYVCMYVCMYIRMCVYIYIGIRTYVFMLVSV